MLVRFGSPPVPLRAACIPLVLWKFLPSHRETGHQPGARLQTAEPLSLLRRSQVGRRKKMLRKGKISCSVLRGYLGGNGTVEGQCCASVSCWRPKFTRSSVTPVWPPHPPSTAQGKQNTSDRFCLIVKRVNCTGLDVGICCKPEHKDLIVSIHLAGGGMPQKDLMLLISSLSWEE